MWSSKSSFTDKCILTLVGLIFGIFICQIYHCSNGKSQINYMLQSKQLKINNVYQLTNSTKKQSITTKILILAYPR